MGGHICGSMLKNYEDANLLGIAAKELEQFAAKRGIKRIRYVRPEDFKISIDACKIAGAKVTGEYLDSKGVKNIVMENNYKK
ncbi:MAG: hypothetical protein E3K37_12555 [Candidatus Kuenenia sp.]|nr:hypothetical protein [Candidatus Kuenenia hertensis]